MKMLTKLCALACGLALAVTACDQGATSPETQQETSTVSQSVGSSPGTAGDRQADAELFEVCKDYVGAVGPDVTVNVDVDSHEAGADTNFDVTLGDGECLDVWLHGGAGLDLVTVTETVPTGYTASFVKTVVGADNTAGSGSGNSASGFVNGTNGVLVVFTNTEIAGGEGCTPGYWKQEHHFDSWVTYSPGDDFDTTFGVDLFDPDITLLEALEANGGGVNALARHAVAALLNATSGIDYDLSEAQVIAAVQAAASSGDFEATKDLFEGFNEQGCPLN